MVAIHIPDWRLVLDLAQERHAGARNIRRDHDRALRATGRGDAKDECFLERIAVAMEKHEK
jgi:hypothetical protein